MTFEMDYDEHTIEIDHDRDWGMEILGIKCPHKDKLVKLKPILKHIEELTNGRPPRVSLERLHLNEQWFRVWNLIECSYFIEKDEDKK